MKWIVVRTYGNGKYMNKVYPVWFEWLSQAEKMCKSLNNSDSAKHSGEKWITMPLVQHIGDVWDE